MHAYGIGLAVSALILLLLMKWGEKGAGLEKGTAEVYGVVALPLSLMLARLVFVLTSAGYFFSTIDQPSKMLCFFDGGYAMTGVIAGLVISAALTAKWTKQPFGAVLDAAVQFAGLPLMIARLSEGVTTLGVGREVISKALRGAAFFTVADEMGTLRHAVYRYEAVVALVLFIVMLLVSRKKWLPGNKALLLGTLYGAAQVVLESMRDDFHMLWGFVRAQQVYAIFLPVIAIAVFSVRIKKRAGMTRTLILSWVLALAAVSLGIIKEFDIDTSKNLFIDYGVMIFAVAVLAGVSVWLMIKSGRKAQSASLPG